MNRFVPLCCKKAGIKTVKAIEMTTTGLQVIVKGTFAWLWDKRRDTDSKTYG